MDLLSSDPLSWAMRFFFCEIKILRYSLWISKTFCLSQGRLQGHWIPRRWLGFSVKESGGIQAFYAILSAYCLLFCAFTCFKHAPTHHTCRWKWQLWYCLLFPKTFAPMPNLWHRSTSVALCQLGWCCGMILMVVTFACTGAEDSGKKLLVCAARSNCW